MLLFSFLYSLFGGGGPTGVYTLPECASVYASHYNSTSVTCNRLKQFKCWSIATRVECIVRQRTPVELRNALRFGDEIVKRTALGNIIVHHFRCELKGAYVADTVVRGKTTGDLTAEAPKGTLLRETWNAAPAVHGSLRQIMEGATNLYGVDFDLDSIRGSPRRGIKDAVIEFCCSLPDMKPVRVQIIPWWNSEYVPWKPEKMDFSANNLRLQAGVEAITLTCSIFISAEGTVRQMTRSDGQPSDVALTSPCRDCRWEPHGNDGVGRNLKLVGTTRQMQNAISRMRSRGFHFVEGGFCYDSIGGAEPTIILFHGTSMAAAEKIAAGQFSISRGSGNAHYGEGVYLTRTVRVALHYALRSIGVAPKNAVKTDIPYERLAIMRVVVRPGKICFIDTSRSRAWQRPGVDTGFLPVEESIRGGKRWSEEWVVRDPARIMEKTLLPIEAIRALDILPW
eukprot:gene9686-6783_t